MGAWRCERPCDAMLKALLTIGLLQIVIMLVNVLRTKALAVLLGPDWLGVMAVVDKLLGVVTQTAALSMPFAALRFVPELTAEGSRQGAAVLHGMRNFLALAAVATTTAGTLVTAFAPGVWGDELRQYRSILFVGFLCLPVLTFVPFLQSAIAARLRHNASMLFALAHSIVLIVASVAGVWWGGLIGLYVVYAALGLVLVLITVRRVDAAAGEHSTTRFAIALPRRIWNFSLALSGLAFVVPFAALYVHYAVLGRFGAETAGWMAAAMGVGFSVRTLLGSASSVFLTPNVNRGGSRHSRMSWVGDYHRTLAVLCGVIAPPLLLFPDVILRVLYSDQFLAAAPFVSLFVVAEIVALLSGTYQSLIIAFNDITFHVIQNVLAQSLLLGLALWLIPAHGILGAGLAGLSAPLFLYVSTALFLRHKHGLTVPLRSAVLAVWVSVAAGLAGMIGASHGGISIGTVAWKMGLYACVVIGLCPFLTAGDRASIRRVARQVATPMQVQW